jgi:bleomycin hydrolase
MGAQQSKTSPETAMHEKAVLDRLRSLHLERSDAGDDFIHVGDSEKAASNGKLEREPEGLAIHLTYDWQTKLLEDPKNRYVYIIRKPGSHEHPW